MSIKLSSINRRSFERKKKVGQQGLSIWAVGFYSLLIKLTFS